MPRVNGMPTEAEEQVALFQWAKLQEHWKPELQLLYAVPNGGSRHKLEAANMKRQGVKAGVPDICLPYPSGGYHGLYIELKVGKNKTSPMQEEWLKRLNDAGYKAVTCYGFLAAKNTIEEYLRL